MIKFQCHECAKKLGVPDEYAEHMVRCPRCKSPTRVPIPQVLVEQDLVSVEDDRPGLSPPPASVEPSAPDTGAIWTDDLLTPNEPDSLAPHSDEDAEADLRACPHCGAVAGVRALICSDCGGSMQASAAGGAARHGAGGYAWAAARVPLALGAGLGTALLVAALWAVVVRLTNYEFGIIAWGLGAAVAGAMCLFTSRRGLVMFLPSILFIIIGILAAKFFITHWYVMPMLDEEIETYREAPPPEILRELVASEEAMFGVGALYWSYLGEFDQEYAFQVIQARHGNLPADQLTPEIIQTQAALAAAVAEWSPTERREVVYEIWPEFFELFLPMARLAGFIGAFLMSFGLFDILWFILALMSAWKITAA